MRGEHFHAESSPRHNKAAFQRGADDAGEGRVKGEIVEKFETDADESEMASLEVIGATQRSAPCTPYGMPLAASVVLRPPSRKPSVCKSMIQTARLSPEIHQIEIHKKQCNFLTNLRGSLATVGFQTRRECAYNHALIWLLFFEATFHTCTLL